MTVLDAWLAWLRYAIETLRWLEQWTETLIGVTS